MSQGSTTAARASESRDGNVARYHRLRWRMLLAVMFCYLFYYTGRQNFGFASHDLRAELGLSATQIGTISAGMLLFYGIGQAINGGLGDRFGARRLMTLGAFLSVVMNWATSFGTSYGAILALWWVNGYVQAFGHGPAGRLIANWWPHRLRGRAYGFFVFAAGFSSVLTFGVCLFVLRELELEWRWLFRLPVLLMLVGGTVFYLVARDRPEDMGLESERDDGAAQALGADASELTETAWQRYRVALSNGRFLMACAAIACESMARYGLLNWVPMHYLGPDWKQTAGGAWISVALPVGMAFGALSGGYLSDLVFKANRSRPIAIYLGLASVAALCLYFVSAGHRGAGISLLFLGGFFAYGPQAAFWALCPDLLGRERAGTGAGLMDACAYFGAAVGEIIIGMAIDATGSTASMFLVVAIECLIGALLAIPIRV
jgi:OPA family glycerol-3-phosphate transporter-like MFS transporter